MGVAQARILSVLIIVFFLMTSLSYAALDVPVIPSGSGACCIPRYQGSLEYLGSVDSAQGINYCNSNGADFIANCYANGALTNQEYSFSGCCCNTQFNIPAVSESSNFYVSKNYCDNSLGSNYNYRGEGNCQSICADNINFYSVIGIVRSNNGQVLDDVIISSDGVTTQTRADGSFDFGSALFEEGTHTFVFSASNDLFDCETETVTRNVNENEFFLDVDLSCVEKEDPVFTCQAQMQAKNQNGIFQDITPTFDGWGECIQVGNEFLRTREVRDLNQCEGSSNGIEYTSSGCEDQRLSFECDGEYVAGEVCDGGVFFINNVQYNSAPSCGQVFPGTTGTISCNSNCLVEFSCENQCTCDTPDQCTSQACAAQCEQEPLCLGCEEALSFIPENAAVGGSVFDLYESLETTAGNFPPYPLQYTVGTNDVTLQWNYNTDSQCANEVLGFDVIACIQDGTTRSCDASENMYVESLTGLAETSYTFENILVEEKSFCYNVVARTAKGNFPAFENDNLPCFEPVAKECIQPSAQGRNCVVQSDGTLGPSSCEYYPGTTHTNLQTITESCAAGEVCIETEYNPSQPNNEFASGAACIMQQPCDSCNGMFGLFASYNLPAFFDEGYNLFMCEELLFTTEVGATVPGLNDAVGAGQCYKDDSSTLFSFYDECSQVTSCYDYLSKGTCSNDPCFKFADVQTQNGVITSINGMGCEWKEYEEELGIGVCQPVQEELQDCSICDTDSPLGFCSKEMCGLYGNCLLKEETGNSFQLGAFPLQDNRLDDDDALPACFHVNDFSCALYDTLEECLGPYEEGQALPEYDVLYQGTSVEFQLTAQNRIAGTNQQYQRSNDLLGFGDCRWDYAQDRCYKDSNGFVGIQLVEDDCDENPSRNCYKDNEPPTTDIYLKATEPGEEYPLYGTGELFTIPFNVQDDYSAPEQITTYVSLLREDCAPQYLPCLDGLGDSQTCLSSTSPVSLIEEAYANGCYIYPQYNFSDLRDEITQSDVPLLAEEGGLHYLIYFSEDSARNLEELQWVAVLVDNSNPVINLIGPDITVLNPYEDVFVSDVGVTIEVYEESNCEAKLYEKKDQEKPVSPGIIKFSADGATETIPYVQALTYPQLDDGEYNLLVECYDDFGNRGFNSLEIALDADSSITTISPIAQVYKDMSQVTLEISTAYDGACRFDITPSNNANSFSTSRFDFDGPIYSNEDGRYYFTKTNLANDLGDASGIYLLQTSCSFDNGETTQGKGGDILSFAIDNISPDGDILEGSTTYTGSTSPWRNSRTLELVCDDRTVNTPTGYNFGCAGIHYCISTQASLNTFNQGNPVDSCTGTNNLYEFIPNNSGNEDFSASLTLAKDRFEYTYLHYFFEDNQGERSQVYTVNTKIRDTDISRPLVIID